MAAYNQSYNFLSQPINQRVIHLNSYLDQQLQQSYADILGGSMGGLPLDHYGHVKKFRKEFKQYTKAEFREMSNKPVVKEILSGLTKLNGDEIAERIKEHLKEI
jgi:hypothetical protein